MPQKKSQDFMVNSKESGVQPSSKRRVSESLRRGQRTYPELRRRDRRLLEDALEFLVKAEGARDPEGTLKALYDIYQEIDPFADYIKPGEREFFTKALRERTLERFLEGFKYIYYILMHAQERLHLTRVFGNFWEHCTDYLAACGYSEKYIYNIFGKDALFYRQSLNYWRSEFKDDEEGFSVMFAYFKSCFGIEGNDEYCALSIGREVTYDWRRMKACFEKLRDSEAVIETVVPDPVYEEWSDKHKQMLRQRIDAYKREREKESRKSEGVLEDIRRRNKEDGYEFVSAVGNEALRELY